MGYVVWALNQTSHRTTGKPWRKPDHGHRSVLSPILVLSIPPGQEASAWSPEESGWPPLGSIVSCFAIVACTEEAWLGHQPRLLFKCAHRMYLSRASFVRSSPAYGG